MKGKKIMPTKHFVDMAIVPFLNNTFAPPVHFIPLFSKVLILLEGIWNLIK